MKLPCGTRPELSFRSIPYFYHLFISRRDRGSKTLEDSFCCSSKHQCSFHASTPPEHSVSVIYLLLPTPACIQFTPIIHADIIVLENRGMISLWNSSRLIIHINLPKDLGNDLVTTNLAMTRISSASPPTSKKSPSSMAGGGTVEVIQRTMIASAKSDLNHTRDHPQSLSSESIYAYNGHVSRVQKHHTPPGKATTHGEGAGIAAIQMYGFHIVRKGICGCAYSHMSR